VQIGVGIVDYLEQKYNEPKGDIAEVAGILGALASVQRSQGMNLVINGFPNINVVVMRAGEWDNSISYSVAQDILTTFPEGTLDVVVGNCDESSLAFMEAAAAVGRTDIGGGYVGADSPVAILKHILDGKAYSTAENGPYYGLVTFEYAIRWLNGETIPKRVMLPNRFWRIQNETQKAAMEDVVTKCEAQGLEFVPAEFGYFDVFDARPPKVEEYYPVFYFDDVARYEKTPYYETTPSTIR
jgi:ribose transport system substrate-binding protein